LKDERKKENKIIEIIFTVKKNKNTLHVNNITINPEK
jgi:hypothetical protein